jgi:hypothetical protein
MTDPADQLYGLPQADFTAARDAAVREAKAAGDKELAARIAKLRKPNAVAWLANQLVRQRRKEVEKLVDLGEQLRAATAGLDGEKLRKLSIRQHELVADLVRQAHDLTDRPVADATERGLEATLRSAMVDPDAAGELLAGRLAEGLTRIGFIGLPAEQTTEPPTPARAEKAEKAQKAEKPEKAEKAEKEADARLVAKAEADRDRAAADLAAAEEALRVARTTVEDLKRRLDEAYEERAQADRRVQAARKRAQQTDRDARLAARGLTDVSAKASNR